MEELKNIVTDVTSGAVPVEDVPGFVLHLVKPAIIPALAIVGGFVVGMLIAK